MAFLLPDGLPVTSRKVRPKPFYKLRAPGAPLASCLASRDHSSSNTWQITGGGQVHPIARSERLLPSDRPEK
jgi:hypothetical protein